MQDKFQKYKQSLETADRSGRNAPLSLVNGSYHQLQTCTEQVRHTLEDKNSPDRTEIADCLLTGSPKRLHADKSAACKGPIDGKCPFGGS
jgi:hypothetical protein